MITSGADRERKLDFLRYSVFFFVFFFVGIVTLKTVVRRKNSYYHSRPLNVKNDQTRGVFECVSENSKRAKLVLNNHLVFKKTEQH